MKFWGLCSAPKLLPIPSSMEPSGSGKLSVYKEEDRMTGKFWERKLGTLVGILVMGPREKSLGTRKR